MRGTISQGGLYASVPSWMTAWQHASSVQLLLVLLILVDTVGCKIIGNLPSPDQPSPAQPGSYRISCCHIHDGDTAKPSPAQPSLVRTGFHAVIHDDGGTAKPSPAQPSLFVPDFMLSSMTVTQPSPAQPSQSLTYRLTRLTSLRG